MRRTLMSIFSKGSVIASDIVEILKSPMKGSLLPEIDVTLGMQESKARQLLGDYILREHDKPLDKIDTVMSVNFWPEIYRLIFSDHILMAVIVEIGVDHSKFKKVYSKVEHKIIELFAHSIEGRRIEYNEYRTYFWDYAKHYCCMHVISDRISYVDPLAFDMFSPNFGIEINGVFVTKRGNDNVILPTIAVIFAMREDIRQLVIHYLNIDLAKRSEVTRKWLPGTFNW